MLPNVAWRTDIRDHGLQTAKAGSFHKEIDHAVHHRVHTHRSLALGIGDRLYGRWIHSHPPGYRNRDDPGEFDQRPPGTLAIAAVVGVGICAAMEMRTTATQIPQ